jgi:hypothetical protein
MKTMQTGEHAAPEWLKPVKVLSVASAPPMDPMPVNIHYFEGGAYKNLVVQTMRPTYFDDVVVTSTFETLPAFPYPVPSGHSPRDLARKAVALGRQARASLLRPVVFSGPVLDMRTIPPNNVAHLMTNLMPYALLARKFAGPGLKVLTQPVGGPFLRLLEHFGLSVVWEDRRITGEIIRVRGTRGLAVYDLLGTFDCDGAHFAPQVYLEGDHSSGAGYERIFLARRAPRNLRNQEEIEAITTAYGYKTIFMEDYPIADQLSIAAQAKHVVAVHGAAMAFLLVNKGLDSVIELLPANVYHQLFATCLGRRVGRWDQIVPEYDPRVAHSGWQAILHYKNRNFSVDVPLMERLLSEIHGPRL